MAFAPREWINLPNRLCILMAGFAWRAGKMRTQGHYWGDIIVTAEHFQDKRRAKALGYAEVSSPTPQHAPRASHAPHALRASHASPALHMRHIHCTHRMRYMRYMRYMRHRRHMRHMRHMCVLSGVDTVT